jgi:hypothetical protein
MSRVAACSPFVDYCEERLTFVEDWRRSASSVQQGGTGRFPKRQRHDLAAERLAAAAAAEGDPDRTA